MNEIVAIARDYATEMHAGQVRKYTNDPYINHPERVAEWMRSTGQHPTLIAAAYLHDVIEDTPATYGTVMMRVGSVVADLVWELTDCTTLSHGNRATRKKMELARLSKCSAGAQTIKLADLTDNMVSIAEHDQGFLKVFLPEADALYDALDKADPLVRAVFALGRAVCQPTE